MFRKIEKTMTSYWLISSNDKIFRLEDYLNDEEYVDWHDSFLPQVGDIVFIYRTKPFQRICYMMEVVAINIPYEDSMEDSKYWGVERPVVEHGNYNRLKLVKKSNTDLLHLSSLKKYGMKTAPQGPRKIHGDLLEYILDFFDEKVFYDEIDNSDEYYEGAIKRISVNKYERDSTAREICIKAHGCKCNVCGLDFEKKYGELGRGFIHVHHIVPISTVGEEYKVDPIKDLIPVCPNCHAMLHRRGNDDMLSVKELQEIIQKQSE